MKKTFLTILVIAAMCMSACGSDSSSTVKSEQSEGSISSLDNSTDENTVTTESTSKAEDAENEVATESASKTEDAENKAANEIVPETSNDKYPCYKVNNMGDNTIAFEYVDFGQEKNDGLDMWLTDNGSCCQLSVTLYLGQDPGDDGVDESIAPEVCANATAYIYQILESLDNENMSKKGLEDFYIFFDASAYDEDENNLTFHLSDDGYSEIDISGTDINGERVDGAVPDWINNSKVIDLEDGSEEAEIVNTCINNLNRFLSEYEQTSSLITDTESSSTKASDAETEMASNTFADILSQLGEFETQTITGSGTDVIEIPADVLGKSALIDFTHDGTRNFVVRLLDSAGNNLDLMVNKIGAYSGTKTDFEDFADGAILEIEADGNWTVTFRAMSTMTKAENGASFSGDNVVYTDEESMLKMTWTHDGERNFIVKAIGLNDTDLLINDIGNYSGTVVWTESQAFYMVEADGNWSVSWS